MGTDDDGLLLLHRPFTRGPSALVFSLGWQERSAKKLSAFSRVCVYIYIYIYIYIIGRGGLILRLIDLFTPREL